MKVKPKALLTKMGESYRRFPKISYIRANQLEICRKTFSEYKPKKILDLGTGNGTISFYLLLNGVVEEAVGVDKEPKAEELFVENAKKLGLDNYAKFYLHDLNQKLSSTFFGEFDGIVSVNTLYYPKPIFITGRSSNNIHVKDENADYQKIEIIRIQIEDEKIFFYGGHGYPINPEVILSQARDLIRDRGPILISNICSETSMEHEIGKWRKMLYTELLCHEIRPMAYNLESGLDSYLGYVTGRNSTLDEQERIDWQSFQKDVEMYRKTRNDVRNRLHIKT